VTPELSVVVPIHNEAHNLAPLVAEIRNALESRVDYEVVCVNDGSDDGTAEQLALLATEFPRLRIIQHRKREGQSAATVHGVVGARAAWIATLDGDGQNDPADIPFEEVTPDQLPGWEADHPGGLVIRYTRSEAATAGALFARPYGSGMVGIWAVDRGSQTRISVSRLVWPFPAGLPCAPGPRQAGTI
jgi:glycosyltransferase involved in cell wall biosynthesis